MEIHLDSPNVGELEKEYLIRCVDSSFVSTYGPFVPEFENKFAGILGVAGAVSIQSGTSALHMALYELGVGPDDEVIVPVITFAATVNPITYVGAKPVFVDVCADTWTIDPLKIKEAITDKTRAIIPVHLYGNPCHMDEIMKIAREHNLYVIEDAAESLCSKYNGNFTGTIGDFGIFSFNGNKVITTGGGGMLIGKDSKQLEHVKYLINQARDMDNSYYHSEVGFNYRMTNLEASFGLAQLEKLESFVEMKKDFYKIYEDVLKKDKRLKLQLPDCKSESAWWLTSVTMDLEAIGKRMPDIQNSLMKKGIPTRRIFMPLTEFPHYKDDNKEKYVNAYNIYNSSLNLPSSTLNNCDNIQYAAEAVLSTIRDI